MARDFEETFPDVIMQLKHPVEATLTLGMIKKFDQVAIRLDEPERFLELIKEKVHENVVEH